MGQPILQSRLLTVALAILLVFLGWSLLRVYPQISSLRKQTAVVDDSIKELHRRTAELEHDAAYLKSEAYLERQARLTLNVKKPGEKVVYFYADQYNAADIVASPVPPHEPWWHRLFGSMTHQ